jgi:hypothetical protein
VQSAGGTGVLPVVLQLAVIAGAGAVDLVHRRWQNRQASTSAKCRSGQTCGSPWSSWRRLSGESIGHRSPGRWGRLGAVSRVRIPRHGVKHSAHATIRVPWRSRTWCVLVRSDRALAGRLQHLEAGALAVSAAVDLIRWCRQNSQALTSAKYRSGRACGSPRSSWRCLPGLRCSPTATRPRSIWCRFARTERAARCGDDSAHATIPAPWRPPRMVRPGASRPYIRWHSSRCSHELQTATEVT